MSKFKDVVEKFFQSAKEEKIVGVIKITFWMNGNKDRVENIKDFEKSVDFLCKEYNMIKDIFHIFYDDDVNSTKITIKVFDKETIIQHISNLNSKLHIRESPKQLLNALGEAIIMLDNYNNRFGDTKSWNMTEEINNLDKILKLAKD